MITIKQKGNFKNLEKFFDKIRRTNYRSSLEKFGQQGVDALSAATPKDSGLTASSWGYHIATTNRGLSIVWTNSHIVNGVPIAVILQYGHGTRNGGYVSGRDYINPAIQPIFDQMAKTIWEEVTKL